MNAIRLPAIGMLYRGAIGTPALFRSAIAKRERPPCAVGIDAKSCLEFTVEEVPLLTIHPLRLGRFHWTHGFDEQMFGTD